MYLIFRWRRCGPVSRERYELTNPSQGCYYSEHGVLASRRVSGGVGPWTASGRWHPPCICIWVENRSGLLSPTRVPTPEFGAGGPVSAKSFRPLLGLRSYGRRGWPRCPASLRYSSLRPGTAVTRAVREFVEAGCRRSFIEPSGSRSNTDSSIFAPAAIGPWPLGPAVNDSGATKPPRLSGCLPIAARLGCIRRSPSGPGRPATCRHPPDGS